MQPLPVPTSTIVAGVVGAEQGERAFHDQFCLRAWDEHGRRNDEVEAPELTMPGEVCDRFAGRRGGRSAPRNPIRSQPEAEDGAGEELPAVPTEDVTRQHLGVERGVFRSQPGVDERRPGLGGAARGAAARHCSLSFSDWK